MTHEPENESFVEHIEEAAHEAGHEISADTAILSNAIGGWRGAIDSGLPSIAFLVVYFSQERNLRLGITCALIVGAILAVVALFQRKSIQQVISGLFGVALSAWITAKTGNAENFFLPGIIRNGIYGLICIISIVIKRPLLGYALHYLRKSLVATSDDRNTKSPTTNTSWREDPLLSRKYSTVTWIWALLFTSRFVIMYPLWLFEATGALGIASVVLGYPLFALAAYGSYLVLRDAKPSVHKSPLL